MPVILCEIEKMDVNSFLWILRCGDNGLRSVIKVKLNKLIIILSIFFFIKFKKNAYSNNPFKKNIIVDKSVDRIKFNNKQ